MDKMKFIYYSYIGKNSLNKVLDQQNACLIHKTDGLKNRFYELFFSCIISNESVDMYDFFVEMKIPYIYTVDKKYQIDMDIVKATYKWIAVYYVVNFSNYIKNEDITTQIKKNLFSIYDFNPVEKELFEKFLILNSESEILFQVDFVKNVSKYMLKHSNYNLVINSLFFNLLYNSYHNFEISYTRYLDIESWLKYA